MRKIILVLILLCSFVVGSLAKLKVIDAAETYEYEDVKYVDLGNVMNVEKDFEMSINGDTSIADAIDTNTILSFGFKYTKEVPSRQWFGFLTQNFQWLNNYSVTINNPVDADTGELENAYIEFGYGSDAHTMCFGKYEANEHFAVNQKYVMDIGVIEVFSDAARKTKVAERMKAVVYKLVGDEYVEVINAQYDHDRFDETIAPSSRGKSFYFYFLEGFSISVGKYYQEAPKYEGEIYEAQTKSLDFYQVLDVDANFNQKGSGDYYISGSGATNSLMSMGVTFTQDIAQRTFVAFNIQYGTSWNGNYSFAFTRNGNITLGYGSDFQTWGFYNFGSFELNRKYIFEYGSVELFGDEELITKIGERIIVNVYQTNDDGTYTLMGSATKDIYDNYYEFFPANRRGNCTFIHQISGTNFSCGFYNRDYKGVVVVNDDYHVVDLSYGAKYDLTTYQTAKPNYEFTGWYYLDSYNRKVFIPEKGVWNYDFSTINDGYYTCEIYANYEPFSCNVNYHISNGVNHKDNVSKIVIGEEFSFNDPIVNEGYIFKGWYLDQNCTNKVESVVGNEDINVYAKIEKASRVTFVFDNQVLETIYVDKENPYSLPSQIGQIMVSELKVNGNAISGEYLFSDNAEVEVIGSYKEYNVTYHLANGTNDNNNPTTINFIEEKVLFNATKEGALFGGWYLDAEYKNEVKSLENITEDIDLYARFYEMTKLSEITWEVSEETPFYLPQLVTPAGSVVSIKLFNGAGKEIELSNGINYYFAEEGIFTLKYHVDTLYGETYDKELKLVVKEAEKPVEPSIPTEPIVPSEPTEKPDDQGCNSGCKGGCGGSLTTSFVGLVMLLGVVNIIRKKENE